MGLFDIKSIKHSKKSKIKIVSFMPKVSSNSKSKLKSMFNLKPVSFIAKPNKPKMQNLIFGYDKPKFANNIKGKMGMDWAQAKAKYPKLNPLGDIDKDGVQNFLDCRPFNPKFQAFGKFKSKPKKNGYTKPEQFTAAERFGGKNIKRLKHIGSGRDRIVYALDNDKVLKIAKNIGGVKQNVPEKELDYILDHVKHYETGKDYVVMEKAGKIKNPKIKKQLKEMFEDVKINTFDETKRSRAIEKIAPDIINYDYSPGDIAKKSSWGEKQGKLVLIDAGVLNVSSLGSEHRITKIQQRLGRAKQQKMEVLAGLKKDPEDKFYKEYLPSLNRDIAEMKMDIEDWEEIQTQRKVFKHKGKVKSWRPSNLPESPEVLHKLGKGKYGITPVEKEGYGRWLYEQSDEYKNADKFKPVKVKMDLNNEKIEPFETVSPVKWEKKTTIPYVDYPDQYNVTKKRVMMTPDEFLELSKQTSYDKETRDKSLEEYKKKVLHPTNVDRIKEGMKKGRHTEELWIAYQDGKPEGHEGRHRAKAAQELGEEKVPVHLTIKHEEIPKEWERYESAEEVAQELIEESEGIETRGRPKKIKYRDWEVEEKTDAQDLLNEVDENEIDENEIEESTSENDDEK